MIIDRLFESEFINQYRASKEDIRLIKKAERILEEEQLSPSSGKAKYISDGKISLEKAVAGKNVYVASGLAEKLGSMPNRIEIKYRIKKTDTGYEMNTYNMSLMDAAWVITSNFAIGSAATFVVMQSASYIEGVNKAMASQQRTVAESQREVEDINESERQYIIAAQREYSFALDKIGGKPGRETTKNPIGVSLRQELDDALSESILSNYSISNKEIVMNYRGHKKNLKALQDLVSLTDRLKEAISKSSMTDEQKSDALKSVRAGEKRASKAYEILSYKLQASSKNQ